MFNGQKGVELHLHFDGSFRPETVFKYANKRGITLPCSNPDDFSKHLIVKEPNSLCSFLKTFDYLLPPIQGDKVSKA